MAEREIAACRITGSVVQRWRTRDVKKMDVEYLEGSQPHRNVLKTDYSELL